MNPDLFANLPESKSPRLLWMEKHSITCGFAASSAGGKYIAQHSAGATKLVICKAETEHDALVEMALQLNIKLWNE